MAIEGGNLHSSPGSQQDGGDAVPPSRLARIRPGALLGSFRKGRMN